MNVYLESVARVSLDHCKSENIVRHGSKKVSRSYGKTDSLSAMYHNCILTKASLVLAWVAL